MILILGHCSEQTAAQKSIIFKRRLDTIELRSSYSLRDIGKIQDITNQLLSLIHRNISREDKRRVVLLLPAHNQNERN